MSSEDNQLLMGDGVGGNDQVDEELGGEIYEDASWNVRADEGEVKQAAGDPSISDTGHPRLPDGDTTQSPEESKP